ncbi:Major Facilitator Superfamily protein [Lutibacter agarilyticus]|uniref:Major Facilitator Superfamily protein n=1 Tax=Lutibacter agarilyticus TaxID=1109740 RepID=A0A238VI79_9FLAO|nr:MFS transporter [Lutibacter agarilyticus]SNR33827.1 Major Facilitator Superfamily protein [Lutibacter agarilyticus]
MANSNRFSFIDPQKTPFFYGYIVLFIGTIGIWASIPGQTVGVSVFTDPVKDALGLSRNEFSNAYMIGTFVSSFFVSRAGVLFDKFGARYVSFITTIILGVALLLCSISVEISEAIQQVFSITTWVIPFIVITVLFFLIRLSGQGVLTMASRNMIMLWFDKNRGKVNSISSIAISLGFSTSPIFLNELIDTNGWEASWQIIAVGLFIFSFFILQFYRNKPEDFELNPDGIKIETEEIKIETTERDFNLKEAKQTRAFWIIGLVLAFNSFFITGFTFHVISIFSSQNYSKDQAIAIFLPISVIAIIVSVICNIMSDYIQHKIYIYVMLFSALLASIGLLLLNSTYGVYVLIVGLGVLGGLFAVVNAVTWPRYYGRKYLGAISGKVMSFLVIASAVAPSLFSYCYTILGSYSYISYLNFMFLGVLIIGAFKLKNPQKDITVS